MERITKEVLDRLYQPVGEITVNWGVTDLSLHHLAFAMFKYLAISPKTHPWPKRPEAGTMTRLSKHLCESEPNNPVEGGNATCHYRRLSMQPLLG